MVGAAVVGAAVIGARVVGTGVVGAGVLTVEVKIEMKNAIDVAKSLILHYRTRDRGCQRSFFSVPKWGAYVSGAGEGGNNKVAIVLQRVRHTNWFGMCRGWS